MRKHLSTLLAIVFLLSLPMAGGAKDHDITRYGAKPDGVTMNTKAIQAAIDKMSAKGGGTVVIPDGQWLSGRIMLKSGVRFCSGPMVCCQW